MFLFRDKNYFYFKKKEWISILAHLDFLELSMLLLMLFSSLSLVLVRPLVSLSTDSPAMTTPPLCCLTMLDHVVSVPSSSVKMNDVQKLIIVLF